MNKRSVFLMAILVVILGAFSAVSFAQESPEAVIIGEGSLTAQGNGFVRITGSGDVNISGAGKLIVFDYKRDATIDTQGKGKCRTQTINGGVRKITCVGFDGTATVSGASFRVTLKAKNIQLAAEGQGVVWLKGNGTFTTGDGTSGTWAQKGVNAYYGEQQ